MTRPAALFIRTQMDAAVTIARPRYSSPMPSRWWSGCSSRAPRPTRRTPNPTAPATSSHPALRVLMIQRVRMMTGSWVCRWAVRVRLAAAFPFLLPERLDPPPLEPPFLPELAERDPPRPDPLREAVVLRADPDLPDLPDLAPLAPDPDLPDPDLADPDLPDPDWPAVLRPP